MHLYSHQTSDNMIPLLNFKGTSLINQAYDTLTNFIIERKIQTGEFLPPEHELCKKLGIARSTLREAVKVLESKGFVKRLHGQGVQIVDESEQATSDMFQLFIRRGGSTINEVIEVRNIFEVQSAAIAAERATSQDITLIQETLQIMQAENVSLKEYAQADINFHLAIAKATHNSVLQLIFQSIKPMLYDVILATLQSNPRPEHVLHYHEKIFKALVNGDKENAAMAMREHLKGTKAMAKTEVNG